MREPLSIHEWRLSSGKSHTAALRRASNIKILLALHALPCVIPSEEIRSSRINRGSLEIRFQEFPLTSPISMANLHKHFRHSLLSFIAVALPILAWAECKFDVSMHGSYSETGPTITGVRAPQAFDEAANKHSVDAKAFSSIGLFASEGDASLSYFKPNTAEFDRFVGKFHISSYDNIKASEGLPSSDSSDFPRNPSTGESAPILRYISLQNLARASENSTSLTTKKGLQTLIEIPPDGDGVARTTGTSGGIHFRYRDADTYEIQWSPWIRLDKREIDTQYLRVDDAVFLATLFEGQGLEFSSAGKQVNFAETETLSGINSSVEIGDLKLDWDSIEVDGSLLLSPSSQDGSQESLHISSEAGIDFSQSVLQNLSKLNDIRVSGNQLYSDLILYLGAANGIIDFQNSSLRQANDSQAIDIESIRFAGNSFTSLSSDLVLHGSAYTSLPNQSLDGVSSINELEVENGRIATQSGELFLSRGETITVLGNSLKNIDTLDTSGNARIDSAVLGNFVFLANSIAAKDLDSELKFYADRLELETSQIIKIGQIEFDTMTLDSSGIRVSEGKLMMTSEKINQDDNFHVFNNDSLYGIDTIKSEKLGLKDLSMGDIYIQKNSIETLNIDMQLSALSAESKVVFSQDVSTTHLALTDQNVISLDSTATTDLVFDLLATGQLRIQSDNIFIDQAGPRGRALAFEQPNTIALRLEQDMQVSTPASGKIHFPDNDFVARNLTFGDASLQVNGSQTFSFAAQNGVDFQQATLQSKDIQIASLFIQGNEVSIKSTSQVPVDYIFDVSSVAGDEIIHTGKLTIDGGITTEANKIAHTSSSYNIFSESGEINLDGHRLKIAEDLDEDFISFATSSFRVSSDASANIVVEATRLVLSGQNGVEFNTATRIQNLGVEGLNIMDREGIYGSVQDFEVQTASGEVLLKLNQDDLFFGDGVVGFSGVGDNIELTTENNMRLKILDSNPLNGGIAKLDLGEQAFVFNDNLVIKKNSMEADSLTLGFSMSIANEMDITGIADPILASDFVNAGNVLEPAFESKFSFGSTATWDFQGATLNLASIEDSVQLPDNQVPTLGWLKKHLKALDDNSTSLCSASLGYGTGSVVADADDTSQAIQTPYVLPLYLPTLYGQQVATLPSSYTYHSEESGQDCFVDASAGSALPLVKRKPEMCFLEGTNICVSGLDGAHPIIPQPAMHIAKQNVYEIVFEMKDNQDSDSFHHLGLQNLPFFRYLYIYNYDFEEDKDKQQFNSHGVFQESDDGSAVSEENFANMKYRMYSVAAEYSEYTKDFPTSIASLDGIKLKPIVLSFDMPYVMLVTNQEEFRRDLALGSAADMGDVTADPLVTSDGILQNFQNDFLDFPDFIVHLRCLSC